MVKCIVSQRDIGEIYWWQSTEEMQKTRVLSANTAAVNNSLFCASKFQEDSQNYLKFKGMSFVIFAETSMFNCGERKRLPVANFGVGMDF